MEDHMLPLKNLLEKYNIAPLPKKCYISLNDVAIPRDPKRGDNIVFPKRDHSLLYLTIETIIDPVNVLSVLCAALLLFVYEFNDEETRHLLIFLATLIIMLIKTVWEVFEESRLNKIYKQQLDLYDGRIIINDHIIHIKKEDIKIGDILDLRRGDIVGADAILIRSNNLKLVRSDAQNNWIGIKRTHTRHSSNFESSENVILGFDRVLCGRGRALVVRIGKDTRIAEIYRNTVHQRKCRSDLYKEMTFMFFGVLVLGLIISGILIAIGTSTGISFFNAIDMTVSIILALIPEGIPSTIKLLLFSTGSKLSRRHIFVRDILSIEKLGLITTVLAEKNALVPKDNIVCSHVYNGDDLIDTELAFVDKDPIGIAFLEKIAHVTDVVSSSKNVQHINTYYQPLQLLAKICRNTFPGYTRKFEKIRDVKLKDLNGVLVDEGEFKSVYAIGSVESVINQCNKILDEEGRLSVSKKAKMINLYHKMRIEGYDCIALCYRSFGKDEKSFKMKGLTFICMYFLQEMPEPDIPLATNIFKRADIKFSIITATHSQDKLKSSRDILGFNDKFVYDDAFQSIWDPVAGRILKFENYDNADEETKLSFLAQDKFIIYRCNQNAKLRIVTDLQERNEIVCFVGSQMCDSLAVGEADIGISFQDSDRICKETSSIILNSQQFEDIIYSLEEGRLFFVNLRKTIRYIFMHITPQIVPFVIYAAFGSPMPLSPILLILLNYFVEVIPAVFFSFEEPEFNLIEEPPCHKKPVDQFSTNVLESNSSSVIKQICYYAKMFVNAVNNGIVYNTATISWAIVEGGLISSIGCELAFYMVLHRCGIPFEKMFFSANTNFQHNSPDLVLTTGEVIGYKEQLNIMYKGQSTYFIGLLLCQFANMLVCRRERGYFFTRFFNNIRIVIYTLCGIAVSCLIIFIPFFERFLLIRRPSLMALLFPAGSAIMLIVLDTVRKFRSQIIQKNVDHSQV